MADQTTPTAPANPGAGGHPAGQQLTLPPGVTPDRYRVDANRVAYAHPDHDPDLLVYIEQREVTGDYFISQDTWSGAPMWNFTLGDWAYPHLDDSYDERHYERPLDEAIARGRAIVDLDEAAS
ncbi:hypothetical protein ACIHFD_49785 [Nonomuraea sp. NPDC051941]|uniref:hypothetical protein n=1 Tax=Nonomuraea sp. NPDC051941 TaxID=3364373 RepID=UPI0037CC3058